jgi:hypothetical protein
MPMDDEGQNGKCILKGLHLRVRQTKTPFLQWRKHSPNPDIPEGVLQIRTKRLKKVHIHAWRPKYRGKNLAAQLVRLQDLCLQLIYYC